MKIYLPPPPPPTLKDSWHGMYSMHTLLSYATACVEADRLEQGKWKEAVLDALADTHMDAPLDESPDSILRRLLDWHNEFAAQRRDDGVAYWEEVNEDINNHLHTNVIFMLCFSYI